mgnify:CR=1 FL=1
MNINDIEKVYEQLKDRYDLVLTTTSALNEGFTIDCPILVGQAHEQIIELYEYEGILVMDVMDIAQTMGTHWHPFDIESAVEDIIEFMTGKSDYEMSLFKQE